MAESILQNLTATNVFDLRGVVAVVTGGGTGIGVMMSTTLVANGATVYIVGLKQADLDRVANVYNDAAKTNPNMGRIYGIEGDVRRKSEAKRIAEEVGKREKHITLLFNNAGILRGGVSRPTDATAESFQSSFFDPVTEQDFDDTLRTNAVGLYWMSFAFLPLLEKWKDPGNPFSTKFVPQIIITSSMNGWTKDVATCAKSYPYQLSKAAIGQATSALAHEFLPLGIRVNGIAPGLFVSEMAAPGTVNELGISKIPLGADFGFDVPNTRSTGSNTDMGSLVLMLVVNWFINGEVVLVDGGTLLKHPSSW